MCAGDALAIGDLPTAGLPAGQLLDADTAGAALETLRQVWAAVADAGVSLGDPIGIHEAVADGRVAYCPLAYGYASYAVADTGRAPVSWGAAPSFVGPEPGSVLGGTGLAVSARSGADLDAVRRWVRSYLDPDVQTRLVPENAGQPAHRDAWESPTVDARWGGYYSATRRTVDSAALRPRWPGWTTYQHDAAAVVRDAVTGTTPVRTAVTRLNDDYARLRERARTGANA